MFYTSFKNIYLKFGSKLKKAVIIVKTNSGNKKIKNKIFI